MTISQSLTTPAVGRFCPVKVLSPPGDGHDGSIINGQRQLCLFQLNSFNPRRKGRVKEMTRRRRTGNLPSLGDLRYHFDQTHDMASATTKRGQQATRVPYMRP
ncbi:hypothetical protein VTN00DRAFT_7261 [Thermoascus crustaceus]|uniref:uncharacterized protein n=1 Tax=Thermoascus crustaceus TaxID=5088 RepID=UPI0037427CAA